MWRVFTVRMWHPVQQRRGKEWRRAFLDGCEASLRKMLDRWPPSKLAKYRVIWGMISIFATGAFSRRFWLLVNKEVTQLCKSKFLYQMRIGRFDPEEERQLQFVLPNGRCWFRPSQSRGRSLRAGISDSQNIIGERITNQHFCKRSPKPKKQVVAQLDLYRWAEKCK